MNVAANVADERLRENPVIGAHLDAIHALCRAFSVARLDLFGSATSEAFAPKTSDVDFIVSFADPTAPGYADRYFGLVESLSALLGRNVDLVVERAIRNHYFRDEIERTRQPIFREIST